MKAEFVGIIILVAAGVGIYLLLKKRSTEQTAQQIQAANPTIIHAEATAAAVAQIAAAAPPVPAVIPPGVPAVIATLPPAVAKAIAAAPTVPVFKLSGFKANPGSADLGTTITLTVEVWNIGVCTR